MPVAFSLYLDLVRFGAALVVVLHHTCTILFPNRPPPFPGHHAVVVFFVLSGFIIAYVSDGRDATLRDYFFNRLSRLWSVAIPSIVISAIATLFVGTVGLYAAPVFPSIGEFSWRAVANLFFFSQSWNIDLSAPLNAPFWSLSYEASYYAIFGAFVFLKGVNRIPVTLIIAVLCGPKILLLMPCWLLGVALYWKMPRIGARAAAILFALSVLAYLPFFWFDLPLVIRDRMDALWPVTMLSLGASRTFVGDWILAAIVAANFVAAANLPLVGKIMVPAKRGIRGAASYTLSLYLYHLPLFAFFYAGLGIHSPVALLLTLATIVLIARVTEHKRKEFRGWLEAVSSLPSWVALRIAARGAPGRREDDDLKPLGIAQEPRSSIADTRR